MIAEVIGRGFDEDWGIEDPTGKADEEFVKVIREFEAKVLVLREQLKVNES